MIGGRGTARVAAGRRQGAAQARLELFAKPLAAPRVDEEGQARSAPRLARSVVAEDQRDGRAHLRGLLGHHERVEVGGEARPARSLLAADGDVEPGDLRPVA